MFARQQKLPVLQLDAKALKTASPKNVSLLTQLVHFKPNIIYAFMFKPIHSNVYLNKSQPDLKPCHPPKN